MDSYRPLIGTPVEELDTPCLLLDLDALEHNFEVVAQTFQDTECKMREHAKNIKSPVVAHMQMRAGGTVGGVCAAKVSEAEVMVEGGIHDILITSQVATRDKIARVCNLARIADCKSSHRRPAQPSGDIGERAGARRDGRRDNRGKYLHGQGWRPTYRTRSRARGAR